MASVSTLERSAASIDSVPDPTFEPDRDDAHELFSASELRQFQDDDESAGRSIVKILATLFIYTLIAMSIVTWWTFQVVQP